MPKKSNNNKRRPQPQRTDVVKNDVDDDDDGKILSFLTPVPKGLRLSEMVGHDAIRELLRDKVVKPLRFPQHFVLTENRILLHGPPGSGKTYLALGLVRELNAKFLQVTQDRILKHLVGKSEEAIEKLFSEAEELLVRDPNESVVIFFDEADGYFNKERSKEMRHLTTQFQTRMCGGHISRPRLVIIGTTNKKDELEDAIRNRFTVSI